MLNVLQLSDRVAKLCNLIEEGNREEAARSAKRLASDMRSGSSTTPQPPATLPGHVLEFLIDSMGDELARPKS